MSDVRISRLHFPVTTLGPGRRVGLWFQGCSIRCAGCISVDTWDAGEGQVSLADVIAELARLAPAADGLTVSGGEPFDQPDALAALLTAWRSVSSRSIFLFTGYERDAIAPWLSAHPGLVDAVMTGPFRSDLPQSQALRGSDNQQLEILSELGAEFHSFDRAAGDADRRLDVLFDEAGHAWFAGIPARGDLGRLRRILALRGHHAEMSDRAARERAS
ncbi:4Fe-4S single cluster domain-containing protein [Sphingopyxis fribergensis]